MHPDGQHYLAFDDVYGKVQTTKKDCPSLSVKVSQKNTTWIVSKYGVISGPYFPAFGKICTFYLSVFSPNAGKDGPEIPSYLDTFHAVE